MSAQFLEDVRAGTHLNVWTQSHDANKLWSGILSYVSNEYIELSPASHHNPQFEVEKVRLNHAHIVAVAITKE